MGEVRAIIGILQVTGVPCFVKSMQVSQSTQQNSDTLNAVLALDGQPLPADFWLTAGEIELEAYVSGGLLFTGSADNVRIDFEQRLVHVSGRDKSKGPIEKKSTETFKNKTSSDIVREIAGRHGLKPVIDSTQDKAGKRQHIDHARITSEISEWTLIQQLADKEGKVAFVQKNELHFKDLDDESLGPASG